MGFRIQGLDTKKFEHLFGLSDEGLSAHKAKRYLADAKPGFPCRLTLEDAPLGEALLLVPFQHQTSNTAYASYGPIFVREHDFPTAKFEDHVPEVLTQRLISLRAYDREGMMLDADVVEGHALEPLIKRFFENQDVSYLHAHFARRGCYAALIERS